MATPLFPESLPNNSHHGVLYSQDLHRVLHTSTTPLVRSSDPVLVDFDSQEKGSVVKNECTLQMFDQLKWNIGYSNALQKLDVERAPSGNDCNIVIFSTVCKVFEQTMELTLSPEGRAAMLECDNEISNDSKQLVGPGVFADFLHRFGSHVFIGNKQLGGAFELTFFHDEKVDTPQRMSEIWKQIWKVFSESDDLYGSAGNGEEYSIEQIMRFGHLNAEFLESHKITKVRATVIGGPPGRCTYSAWYQALENQDNCEFSTIEGKLLPVWDFIEHNADFLLNKNAVVRLFNETFKDLNSQTIQDLEGDQTSSSTETTVPKERITDGPEATNLKQLSQIPQFPNDFVATYRAQNIAKHSVTAKEKLIDSLGLTEYYPGKITCQKALSVEKEAKETARHTTSSLRKLPWKIIRNLINVNYKCREDDIASCKTPSPYQSGCSEFDFEALLEESDTPNESDYLPNPVDVMLVIYECCDAFLKQLLAPKMSLCRLAIPILLPFEKHSVFALWPLRNVSLEWKLSDKVIETSVANHHFKTMIFIRMGSHTISKSKLANTLISDESHNVFFHRDCHALGDVPQVASDGMVEVCPFLPSGSKDDPFNEEILFLNLRGDACKNKHTDSICRISSVVVVIVSLKILTEQSNQDLLLTIGKSSKVILLLTSDKGLSKDEKTFLVGVCNPLGKNIKPVLQNCSGKTKNYAALCGEIRKYVNSYLPEMHSRNLEEAATMFPDDVHIDENETQCQKGRKMAQGVIRHINDSQNMTPDDMKKLKSTLLPLSSSFMAKWNAPQKRNDSVGYKIYEEGSENDKMKEKLEQLNVCKNLGPLHQDVIRHFIDDVEHLNDSILLQDYIACLTYFLKWLKLLLDGISHKLLPKLRTSYKELWKKHAETTDQQLGRNYKKETDKIEQDVVNASFGMEHIMREISQLYETISSCNHQEINDPDLMAFHQHMPNIMANLLLSGQPFEIMNGDSRMISMSWIHAILTALSNKIGNKKLCVISVVGIQSSGKSTLLNAMFGLEFAVSAGRCTRGIFAQLIPVAIEDSTFDYLLILDTEGLRAPEMAKNMYKFDNALATMVLGLSDFTLINLKGENTTEIQDVLEIVVHAFLRMKLADKYIQHKCGFIHHNTDGVSDKMTLELKKQHDHLNDITKNAAEAEQRSKSITKFEHVIEYDPQKQHWQFSNLYYGNPPNAPINPSYSKSVVEVRNAILNGFSQHCGSCVSIEEFKARIQDMWTAVLSDDFVYGFKNSYAIKAYTSLDAEFYKLVRHMEDSLRTECLENLCSEVDKCYSESSLETEDNAWQTTLRKEVNKEKTEKVNKLEKFIKQSDNQYMYHWQEAMIKSMRDFGEELHRTLFTELRMKIDQKRLDIQSKSMDPILQKEILKCGALQNASDDILEIQFENIWQEFKSKNLSFYAFQHTGKCISEEMVKNLNLLFGVKAKVFLEKELSNEANSVNFETMNQLQDIWYSGFVFESNHIDIILSDGDKDYQYYESDVRKYLFDEVFTPTENVLERICNTNQKFNSQLGKRVLDTFSSRFDDHRQRREPFEMLITLKVKLGVLVAKYATMKFQKMDTKFETTEGLEGKLNEMKERGYRLFKHISKESENEAAAADLFCVVIKPKIKEKIEKGMSLKICSQIREELQSKYYIMVEILTELADTDSFKLFMEYILDSGNYVESWLMKRTQGLFFGKQDAHDTLYATKAIDQLYSIMDSIRSSTNSANNTIKKLHQDKSNNFITNIWIDAFCEKIKRTLDLKNTDFTFMASMKMNLSLLDVFSRELDAKLDEMLTELVNDFRHEDGCIMNFHSSPSPYEEIYRTLWGCTAQCPLCRQPCSRLQPNHKQHICNQHRIGGVQGRNWFKSEELVLESCSVALYNNLLYKCTCPEPCTSGEESTDDCVYHEYKDFPKYHPDWDIHPEPNDDNQVFWKYFMCKYKDQLAEYFNKAAPQIPQSWYKITLAEAKQSIRDSLRVQNIGV